MPLDKPGLEDDLAELASEPGATIAASATLWADAMQDYASGVVPASSAVSTAAATLETALASAFENTDADDTADAMESAFAAFAATIAAGMAPAFTGTPPAGDVGFADLFESPFPVTHALAADGMADAIDDWMTSGTAVPSGGGSTIDWS